MQRKRMGCAHVYYENERGYPRPAIQHPHTVGSTNCTLPVQNIAADQNLFNY